MIKYKEFSITIKIKHRNKNWGLIEANKKCSVYVHYIDAGVKRYIKGDKSPVTAEVFHIEQTQWER